MPEPPQPKPKPTPNPDIRLQPFAPSTAQVTWGSTCSLSCAFAALVDADNAT